MPTTLTKKTKKAAGPRRPGTRQEGARRPNQVPAGLPADDALPGAAGRDGTSGAGQTEAGTQGSGARPARTNGRKGHPSADTQGRGALPATNQDAVDRRQSVTLAGPVGGVSNHDDAGRPSADTPSPRAGVVPNQAVADAVAAAVAQIRHLHRFRCGVMLAAMRQAAQARAYVRYFLGYSVTLPEKERERITAEATAIIDAITKGQPLPDALAPAADAVRPFVLLARDGAAPYLRARAEVEKELTRLVESLPVWDAWAKGVKGLSQIGVATYIGECGDLLTYSNPGKVWARLGLAPKPYYGRKDAKGAEYFAIPKIRRSRSWSITDILLRQPGEYQDLYRSRREYELANHPEFGEGRKVNPKTGRQGISRHGDLRARRFVEKRLVKHLWLAWHKAAGVEPAVPPHELDATTVAAA